LTVLSGQQQAQKITMDLGNTQNIDFKTYIGLAAMGTGGQPNANFALASMLFSENNLNSNMDVGFKGNPNIGSVVLNQFSASQEFINFAASFAQGDRIFIISSIFGGTGASGFPLLLKNLRTISNAVNGNGLIKVAPIGAVSILPYFNVAPPGNTPDGQQCSQIDSSTFISKTKAALSYYDKNMTEANVLYYIGDGVTKQYNNSEGGVTQQNDAHFIELAAALAIIDFAQIPDNQLPVTIDPNNNNGVVPATTVVYKEFGITNPTPTILFSDLDISTQRLIKKPMTQFTLFCKYMNEQIENAKDQQPWAIDNKFDDAFFSAPFYRSDLTGIKNAYWAWLTEMSNNQRAFTPYNLSTNKDRLFVDLIPGEKPKKKWWSPKNNYALFDDKLNKQKTNDGQTPQQFFEIFYKATEEIVRKKFN
jgi:hypothetical protein